MPFQWMLSSNEKHPDSRAYPEFRHMLENTKLTSVFHRYQLPVTSNASAINAVPPQRAASQIQGVPGHESPHGPTANNNSEHMVIGIILSNGEVRGDQYRCNARVCSGMTFGRLADLKRHHSSLHGGSGGKKQHTWCPVDGCESSSTMPILLRHQAP